MKRLSVVEVCAGAGGISLGLEQAGFEHLACVDVDEQCCETLRENRPQWDVLCQDMATWEPESHLRGVDLFVGGVPCPPFSRAGKRLGSGDERDMFPHMLRLVSELAPRAVLIENVPGILDDCFGDYRESIESEFGLMGFETSWILLNAVDFGVPQERKRAFLVATRCGPRVKVDKPNVVAPTVADAIADLMTAGGWNAKEWALKANRTAPTIVGGSKKHGGADLGPTGTRKRWASMGVEGKSLANEPPPSDFVGNPRLTLKMVARLQGFPDDWKFTGGKTSRYRQIGNALPPAVAEALGKALQEVLLTRT